MLLRSGRQPKKLSLRVSLGLVPDQAFEHVTSYLGRTLLLSHRLTLCSGYRPSSWAGQRLPSIILAQMVPGL